MSGDRDRAIPFGSGLSPTVEPASSLDGSATSIPIASVLALLAEFERAGADCPARRRHLGDANCPKCHATKSEGCRLEVRAAYSFVTAMKELIDD